MYSLRIKQSIQQHRQVIASRLKCPWCDYVFDSRSKLKYTSCSNCRRGFNRLDNTVKRMELEDNAKK